MVQISLLLWLLWVVSPCAYQFTIPHFSPYPPLKVAQQPAASAPSAPKAPTTSDHSPQVEASGPMQRTSHSSPQATTEHLPHPHPTYHLWSPATCSNPFMVHSHRGAMGTTMAGPAATNPSVVQLLATATLQSAKVAFPPPWVEGKVRRWGGRGQGWCGEVRAR